MSSLPSAQAPAAAPAPAPASPGPRNPASSAGRRPAGKPAGNPVMALVPALAGMYVVLLAGHGRVGETSRADAATAVGITVLALLLCFAGARITLRVADRAAASFQPLGFPMAYVAASFLAAPAYVVAFDTPIGDLTPGGVAEAACVLMALATCAVLTGAMLFLGPPRAAGRERRLEVSGAGVTMVGRLVTLGLVAYGAWLVRADGVLSRGEGQGVYDASDAVDAMVSIATPIGPLLLLIGNRARPGNPRMLAAFDWALVIALIAVRGLAGSRGAVVGLFVLLALWAMRYPVRRVGVAKRAARWVLFVAAAVAFSMVVLTYRNTELGAAQTQQNAVEAVLTDVAVAASTTVGTQQGLDSGFPSPGGRTFVEEAIRLIPSPVSVPMFGPPEETATLVYRQMIGLDNASQGVGYSLPAEGYLNFGETGMLAVCFLVGAGLSGAYRLTGRQEGSASAYLYIVVVATFPFALRSDALGAGKGVLYGWLMVAAVLVLLRSARPDGARR